MSSVNPGDVAVLKGAINHYLTVTRVISPQADTVEVAWFNNGELKTAIVPAVALKPVKHQ
jgi:hypothetical protein